MKRARIAIVGATGLVGTTLILLLEERTFPIDEIHFIASSQSKGKEIVFRNKNYQIEDLSNFDFSKTNLAFFCIGNELSARYAPIAVSLGNIVIDKSFYFRNHNDVPLIIPEINLNHLSDLDPIQIISVPNCNTIPIAVALKPIYDAVGINRVNIATYQSVSGSGKEAVHELTEQTKQLLNKETILPKVYQKQIAFNVLPHIDDFEDNGYTREEMKMVWEIKKIFNDPEIAINPTAVRVPVYCGHAASVHVETKRKITKSEAENLLKSAKGVELITGAYPYATPVTDAQGKDPVYVGRIREDISHEKGLNMWVVADNLRKGAGLNSIQIAEHLLESEKL